MDQKNWTWMICAEFGGLKGIVSPSIPHESGIKTVPIAPGLLTVVSNVTHAVLEDSRRSG